MKKIVIALAIVVTIVSCDNAADSTMPTGADSVASEMPGAEDTTKRIERPVTLKREQADTGHTVLLQEAINGTPKYTPGNKDSVKH